MIPGITAQASTGASGTPTERWWRVRFPTLNNGNTIGNGSNEYIDLRYMSLATEPGGTNLISSALAYDGQPHNNPAGPTLATDSSSIKWNNAGNQGVGEGCFVAFKLPTPLPINELKIRVHSTASYSPRDIVVESSWDGVQWDFEFGYCYIGWSGGELKTFLRQSIDWTTYTARDWMVRCFKSSGYSNLGIDEMEMAETIGGTDLCTGGTPRSTNNSTYPASNLTDNNLSTLCGSLGAARTTHVGYSFATAVNINEVRFLSTVAAECPDWGALCVPTPGSGTPGSYNPSTWYIKQLFNGAHKIGFTRGTAFSLDMRNPRVPPSPTGAHRYWRVRPTSDSWRSEQAFSATEIDWKASGSSLVGAGTPIASNQFSASYVPAYAYDGNDATVWHSDNNTVRTWIGYDFGTAVLPDQLVMKSRNDGSLYNQFPVFAEVEYSDDGFNWYRKKAIKTTAPAAALEVQTYSLT